MKESFPKQKNNGGFLDMALESISPNRALFTAGRQLNEKGFFETSNDSLKVTDVPSSLKVEDVDAIAYYLAEKFRNLGGLKFYQKVAWHIPRGTIDRLVALAFDRGQNPGRYFSTLAINEMNREMVK